MSIIEPTVISFYTKGDYEADANRLRYSCQQFGFRYDITPIETQGSWVANCSYKGTYIRDTLVRLKGPILWIDADGEIVNHFDTQAWLDCDFACYVESSIKGTPPRMNSPKMPFRSGTVFLNYTPAGVRLANRWADLCAANPGIWDQVTLAAAWWESRPSLKFYLLPQGYCKIFDRIWREKSRNEYIIHYQASRRLRRDVSSSRYRALQM